MKKILRLFLFYFISLFVLISMCCCLNLINRSYIRKNLKKSINYLEKKSKYDFDYYYMFNRFEGSKQDVYADSILLNVIYSMDSKHPIKSFFYAGYYDKSRKTRLESLSITVDKFKKPNEQYIRYYHGSLLWLKPLLLIFSLKEIILLNIVLFLLLLFLLAKQLSEYKDIIVITIVSLLLTTLFFGLFSLEYMGNIIIMLFIANLAVLFEKKEKNYFNYLFLFSGLLTYFTDFLTTETLTFMFPIALVLLIRVRKDDFNFKKNLCFVFVNGLCWFGAYFLTFMSKGILSSFVLNINAFNYIKEDALRRSFSLVSSNYFVQVFGAVFKNVVLILPFGLISFKSTSFWIVLFFIIIVSSFYYLFRKQGRNYKSIFLFIVGLIPIVRYMVLSNHSYLHFFFTYRSLFPVLILWIYAFYYGIDWKVFKYKKKNKKGK